MALPKKLPPRSESISSWWLELPIKQNKEEEEEKNEKYKKEEEGQTDDKDKSTKSAEVTNMTLAALWLVKHGHNLFLNVLDKGNICNW